MKALSGDALKGRAVCDVGWEQFGLVGKGFGCEFGTERGRREGWACCSKRAEWSGGIECGNVVGIVVELVVWWKDGVWLVW